MLVGSGLSWHFLGTVGYDGGLLKVFRRYDDDHSGSITANEMAMMVRIC